MRRLRVKTKAVVPSLTSALDGQYRLIPFFRYSAEREIETTFRLWIIGINIGIAPNHFDNWVFTLDAKFSAKVEVWFIRDYC